MTLLHSEIKEDLSLILSGLQKEGRPVASTFEALKVSSFFPALILSSNIICWLMAYMLFVSNGDNTGLGLSFYAEAAMLFMSYGGWISLAVTLVIGFFFTLVFLPTSLIYVSIPKEVRGVSKITSRIVRNLRKVSIYLWLISSALTVAGLIYGKYVLLYAFPATIFLGIFIFNGYIGIETVRYGLGPLIEKISSFKK